MKNQKSKNYQNQYLLNKNISKNSYNILPPTKDNYYFAEQKIKEEDFLSNNKKYIDLNNNSYNISSFSDFNNKYELNNDYSNKKYIKYNEIPGYNNNYEYQKYIEDGYNMKFENENGNEKLHQIKDEYIEYLQKQLDDNNKNMIKLETKSNEFQKRYKNLIEDNKLLNETLNERTSKLNEIIQENENLRLQLNNNIENENKINLQIQYYEKKMNLYENNINELNKIINELKEKNEKLSISKNDENTNTESNNNNDNNNYLNINDSNEEELQLIKNQNLIYLNNIKSKDNTIELMTKENEKLMNENRIYRTQIEQYTQQISNLYNTIKQKNKIINIFKLKEGIIDNCNDIEFEKKLEGMKVSLSQENIHFLNNNNFINSNNKDILFDLSKDDILNNNNTFNIGNKKNNEKINQNIDKLITDNEENKMKIEILNNKIKSLDQLEKKYFEFMKNNNINEDNDYLNSNNEKDYINENKNENEVNSNVLNITEEELKNETYNKLELVNDMIKDESNCNNSNSNGSVNDLKSYDKYIEKRTDENKYEEREREREKEEEIEREEKEEEKERKENEEREREEREKKEKEEKEKEEKEQLSRAGFMRRRKMYREQKEKEEEEKKRLEEEKKKEENNEDEIKRKQQNHGREIIKDEKEEIKETVREMNRKKNYTHIPKTKKRFKISDELDVTEINTASPVVQQNLSFSIDDKNNINSNNNINNRLFLFGIDRNDNFHIFDLKNKRWSKRKILDIEDISDTFQKDYQYEGTILYNILNGVFILTGQKLDVLYYYNAQNETINKICKFNNSHDNGSLMLDKEYNRLFVFGGKNTYSCEYYSFNDKKVINLPDLNYDRANASFIICNNKIYGFFGFSYNKNNYTGNIEYIDNKKLDKWCELKNINYLNKEISFDVESVSTLHYKENLDKILIYAGIQGDNEDFITEHYYLYDSKDNSIDLIKKWANKILKYSSSRWRNYNLTKRDPSGFHFAKNSNFLELPKGVKIEGYDDDDLDLLIDYKNNVHFINQEKKTIDIFKSDN